MGELTVLCKKCGDELDAQTDPGPGGGLPEVAVHLFGDFYVTSSGALCKECANQ